MSSVSGTVSGSAMAEGGASPGRGRLVVLVGPAGAGKTTLAHRLLGNRPGERAFSVSHTTRPRREREAHGVDYYFVDRPTFENLRDRGGFVEWARVHDNLYGTSKAEIERLAGAGRDVLFDIDIQGAHDIWRQYPDQTRLAFVLPPSWAVLVQRLVDRGSESEETLRRRLRTARSELQGLLESPAPWQVILNDALEPALTAMESHLFSVAPQPGMDVRQHPAVRAFLRDALSDPRAS